MKEEKIERSIIKYVWIYATVVSVFLVIVFNVNYMISFILGTCASLLGFTLIIKTVDKVIKYDDARKKSELITRNILNLGIYFIVLLCAGFSSKYGSSNKIQLNIICTAIGLLSVKIVIYFKEFIIDKFFIKNKNKTNEIISDDSNEKEGDE